MKKVIIDRDSAFALAILAISMLCLFVSPTLAQYDVTTQGVKTIGAAGFDPHYVAGSNLGQFVVGGNLSNRYSLCFSGASLRISTGNATGNATGAKTPTVNALSEPVMLLDPPWPDSLKLYWASLKHMIDGDTAQLRVGRDTMELYIQLHPFATTQAGQVLNALSETGAFTNSMGPGLNWKNWKELYNFLVDAQTWSSDVTYQNYILQQLANSEPFDVNDEANFWYNYTLIFPDSADVAFAASGINQIRHAQSISRNKDTTAFHKITFPLKKLPIGTASVAGKAVPQGMSLALSPNPASQYLNTSFFLPEGGKAELEIYDEVGSRVRQVVSEQRPIGGSDLTIPINDLASGRYFMRLSLGSSVVTKEFVVQH